MTELQMKKKAKQVGVDRASGVIEGGDWERGYRKGDTEMEVV